jgi:hypothetical protein
MFTVITRHYFILLLIATTMICCSSSKQFKSTIPIPGDQNNVPCPKGRNINPFGEYFDKQITEQIEQSLNFSRQLRNLFNKRKEAFNIDAFGNVPNSSWYTNRNGIKRLSLEDIRRGPNSGTGPDTSGSWIITRAKAEGVTPGFTIKDSRGDNYLIKFDPIGYSELASGAEVVSTKLFYAMGYNTPENYIVYFHPRILNLGDKVKFTDKKGHKRYMTNTDMAEILNRIQHEPDGRIRALASKYLPGKPIGPFKYKGLRKDDPNDFIPHHHRRELRGLRVFAAWLNHFDTKDGNSLDVYFTEGDISFVKHYLIDFGATLGSASHGPNHLWRGYKNDFDPIDMLKTIFTIGFYVRPWEKQKGVKYTSIGRYESQLFHPHKYKSQVPNPAFENMTYLDAYWAAKIVMSFSDEQLKAVVEEGQYSNQEARDYLLRTLIERRDKIGRYYFSRVIPLDNFAINESPGRRKELCFTDLAVQAGFAQANSTVYRYETSCEGKTVFKSKEMNYCCIPMPQKEMATDYIHTKNNQQINELQWEIKLHLKRKNSKKWSKWIKVYIVSDLGTTDFDLIGIRRQR